MAGTTEVILTDDSDLPLPVMPVLDTGIHANTGFEQEKTWMAGTDPPI
jgi:hypothetical protein